MGQEMSVERYRVQQPEIMKLANTQINDPSIRAQLWDAEAVWMQQTKAAHDAYVAASPLRMGNRARQMLQAERATNEHLAELDAKWTKQLRAAWRAAK